MAMYKLFNFARVIITTGPHQGCIGRFSALADEVDRSHLARFREWPFAAAPTPSTVPLRVIYGDDGVAEAGPHFSSSSRFPIVIYNDVVELFEDGRKQPSASFLSQHAVHFCKIINTAMEDCIKDESKFNLEHISALGKLYDFIVLQETGYEKPFWDLYIKTFGPIQPMKKRPKSARKLA